MEEILIKYVGIVFVGGGIRLRIFIGCRGRSGMMVGGISVATNLNNTRNGTRCVRHGAVPNTIFDNKIYLS